MTAPSGTVTARSPPADLVGALRFELAAGTQKVSNKVGVAESAQLDTGPTSHAHPSGNDRPAEAHMRQAERAEQERLDDEQTKKAEASAVKKIMPMKHPIAPKHRL